MTGEPLYVITCSRCGAHQRPESLGLYCDGPDTRPPIPGEPAAANCGGLIEIRRAALLVERRPSTGEEAVLDAADATWSQPTGETIIPAEAYDAEAPDEEDIPI